MRHGDAERDAVIAADLHAAWGLYRLLRASRACGMRGHGWVRVDLAPGRAAAVAPRRFYSKGA